MITVSKYSSLYFGKREDWAAPHDTCVDYVQKYAVGETMRVQFSGSLTEKRYRVKRVLRDIQVGDDLSGKTMYFNTEKNLPVGMYGSYTMSKYYYFLVNGTEKYFGYYVPSSTYNNESNFYMDSDLTVIQYNDGITIYEGSSQNQNNGIWYTDNVTFKDNMIVSSIRRKTTYDFDLTPDPSLNSWDLGDAWWFIEVYESELSELRAGDEIVEELEAYTVKYRKTDSATRNTVHVDKIYDDGDGKLVFEFAFSVPDAGLYEITIESVMDDIVSYFCIKDKSELKNTVLLNYTHRRNEYETIFNDSAFGVRRFNFRTEGGILPLEKTQALDNETFRDQRFTSYQLSAEAYEVSVLTIGTKRGVPQWVGNRVNHIFKLSDVLVNGVETKRNEGSTPELVKLGDYWPLCVYKLNVEQSDREVIKSFDVFELNIVVVGSDGLEVQNYEPDDLLKAFMIRNGSESGLKIGNNQVAENSTVRIEAITGVCTGLEWHVKIEGETEAAYPQSDKLTFTISGNTTVKVIVGIKYTLRDWQVGDDLTGKAIYFDPTKRPFYNKNWSGDTSSPIYLEGGHSICFYFWHSFYTNTDLSNIYYDNGIERTYIYDVIPRWIINPFVIPSGLSAIIHSFHIHGLQGGVDIRGFLDFAMQQDPDPDRLMPEDVWIYK